MNENIMADIQGRLKAPKGQENKFGKYKYRSCEDIVEAVKPLLNEHDCYLLLGDEMVMLGDRYYVKATAAVVHAKGIIATTDGYARECQDRKGMDESQITGATSSYARKYALNGLFAIDDTKDADTMDNTVHVFKFKAGEKDEIIKQVKDALFNGDESALKEILDEYHEPEQKMAVWALFTSRERSSIKEMLNDDK
jgi:hypothetical protein